MAPQAVLCETEQVDRAHARPDLVDQGLQVVARESVLAYRDGAVPDSQIGSELGASYLVKGSVRRAEQLLC